ncbi:MAG: hypothetical protein WCO58_00055 [bacterium]
MKNKMTAPVWALLLMLSPVLFLPITKLLFPLIELDVIVYLLFSIGGTVAGYYFFNKKKQARKMNRLYDNFNNEELVENCWNLDDGNFGGLFISCFSYVIGSIYLRVLLDVHYKHQDIDSRIAAVLIVIACMLVFVGWLGFYGNEPYEYRSLGFIKKQWLVPEYPDKEDVEYFVIVTKGEHDPNEEKIKSLELKRLREEIQSTLQEDIVAYNEKQQEKLRQEEQDKKEAQETAREEEKFRQEILRLVNIS